MSQLELSRASKLSRQLISTLETGRHIPSVKAALAIAQVLGTNVEELFGESAGVSYFLPAFGEEPSAAVSVVAVRVGDAVTYHPIPEAGQSWGRADGLYRDGGIRLFEDSDTSGIIVAGCDPALGLAASLLPNHGPQRVVGVSAPSGKAMKALDAGLIHGGLVHGRAGQIGDGTRPFRRFIFARWRVGLACLPGMRIDLEKLARGAVTTTRRDPDAEVQRALERKLTEMGIDSRMKGPSVAGHLDAARRVGYGAVDVALTMEAAARAFGLDFLELEEHVCELRVAEEWADLPGTRGVLELIRSEPFHARLQAVCGYDVTDAGKQI